MNDLQILNSAEDSNPTVSARDLYEMLNIEKRFSAWFETNSQGFIEGIDFTSVPKSTLVNNGAKRILDDYKITVDMAKHICLMSRTEKGKQVRQYLIDLEKAWNTPELVMARGLMASQRLLEQKEEVIKKQAEVIEMQKPKVLFADAVASSRTSILVGDMAKLIAQNGYEIGQKRLFAWLRDNGYLIKSGDSRNLPTQRSIEQGLIEIKESSIQNPDGSVRITKTPKITGKGQLYFVNKFMRTA